MATPIHPDALRAFRARKRWTQEQLADATRGKHQVSLPTIKRIESTKIGCYAANDRKAEALANALGVKAEDFSAPPSDQDGDEASLRKFGYRPLRTMLDAETALAFNMVQHIYGISIRSQIEMAPLFAALLAEGSLSQRRALASAIDEASSKLQDLGGGHRSFVNTSWRVDEGLVEERKSIAQNDIFGVHASDEAFDCGYDRSKNNPFADYLQNFASEAQADTITFKNDFGWKASEGLPDYTIGAGLIERVTGGDPDAEYALIRGHVRLKEIPDELQGDHCRDARVAWMIGRIPQAEMDEREADREEFLSLFDNIDVSSIAASEGGDHA